MAVERESIPDDARGFRAVFERLKDPVFRLLSRLARSADDAEDLLQETFSTLWRKREQFRGDGSLEGYAKRIAFRTWLNARERLQRNRAALPLDAELVSSNGHAHPPEQGVDLDRLAALAAIRRVVEELPEEWRVPFVLFRYEGLSCREVAEVMDLSPKAVEMRLSRGLKEVARRVRGATAPSEGSSPRPASGGER